MNKMSWLKFTKFYYYSHIVVAHDTPLEWKYTPYVQVYTTLYANCTKVVACNHGATSIWP